jgi:cobalamin biosynthesis Co2+ chelatase CbiK
MFAYTAILIPIMNGILYVIGKYDLNVDTFLENFAALAMGVGTLVAKNGIISIIDKLKDKISTKDKKEIVDEVDTTVIKKVSDFTLDPADGEMINEQ